MFSRCQEWLTKQQKKCKIFRWSRWSRCTQAGKASTEFTCDGFLETPPEQRNQSLTRRLLGGFLSERDITDEEEQLFLKQLLKDHGLYNKHQTLQQRRRLKQLLEHEHQSYHVNERGDDSLLLHSLTIAPCDISGSACTIEINHEQTIGQELPPKSVKFRLQALGISPTNAAHSHFMADDKLAVPVWAMRRAKSLSILPFPADKGWRLDSALSQRVISQESSDVHKPKCIKTVSWESSPAKTHAAQPYLETSV